MPRGRARTGPAALRTLLLKRLEELTGRPVGRGVFGADTQVSLVNDGPVTIIADTDAF